MNAVEKVRREYEKNLAKAELEDALCALAPKADRIFVSPLYDSVAWITYGDQYGQACTWDDAKEAARQHPAMGAMLVKKASTSFRPASREWDGDECTRIAPVWLEIETYQGARLKLHWYSETPNGIVRIDLEMGDLSQYPSIAVHDLQMLVRPGSTVVGSQRLSIGTEMHAIRRDDECAIAQVESPIKWASGGPQYPSRYTLYFSHLDAEPVESQVAFEMIKFMGDLCRKESK